MLGKQVKLIRTQKKPAVVGTLTAVMEAGLCVDGQFFPAREVEEVKLLTLTTQQVDKALAT